MALEESAQFGDWMDPRKQVDLHAHAVIIAANEVHRLLGPGFDEPVYEEALCSEMLLRGVPFLRNPVLAVKYKGRRVGEQRLDLLVGDELIVDLYAIESDLSPIESVKMQSYLRATDKLLGLLINFNVPEMIYGIKRVWSSRMGPPSSASA